MAHLDQVIGALAAQLAHVDPDETLPLRLCRAAVGYVGAEGGALTMTFAGETSMVVATTGSTARSVESLQSIVGDGPEEDARRTRRPARLTVEPGSARQTVELDSAIERAVGPLEVVAYPMVVRDTVVGTFTALYAEGTGTGRSEEDVLVLASLLGAGILAGVEDPTSLPAWPARARLHQATGMVVAQLRISPFDALTLVRAHAYADDTDVDEVATALLDRRLSFHPDAPSTGEETP